MHELSIASAALEQALDHAHKAGSNRVARIVVRVGELSGVDADALQFAFAAILPGTDAEGAELEIAPVPAIACCPDCQRDFSPGNDFVLACPVCGRISADLKQGRELELTRLEFY